MSLEDIGDWSTENFGLVRARHYTTELLSACRRVASGIARWRHCRDVFAPDLRSDLRFAGSGRHFIIFAETPEEIVIVDFIHQYADIGGGLEGLDQ